MANKTLNVRQQQKSDTATNWTTNNPVLLAGELGFESDTGKFKIGDGTTAWSSLSYVSTGSGGTATDVQINGTSITSNNVANILTNGTYNSSTNKIATMSDIPSGITEISTQYTRITDLSTGVYKLTYNGTKYLYYSGTTLTSTHTVAGGAGAVILTVNRYSTTYWHWYYINGSSGYETIYFGYTSSSTGSTSSKQLNSLLTSISSYVKDNLTYSTSGTSYALSAYQGYQLNQNKQDKLPTTTTAGQVLKSTSTAGTVEWGNAPANITITTTSGSESVSDGTNTLNFGSNAFTSTTIPTDYVKLSSGELQTITLNSGSGTTALGLKSKSTSSYLSFSGTNGWIASFGINANKKPVVYDGSNHVLAYTSDVPTIPTTTTAGKVLKSTSTSGTVEWGEATGITTVNGLSGGTLTSPLIMSGGDGSNVAKIILDSATAGQITNNGNSTLLGFASSGTSTFTVGASGYALNLRGSDVKINGNSIVETLGTDYVKYANGLQICWGHTGTTSGTIQCNFGSPFKDTSYSIAMAAVCGGSSAMTNISYRQNAFNKNTGYFQTANQSDIANGSDWIAIGKWK